MNLPHPLHVIKKYYIPASYFLILYRGLNHTLKFLGLYFSAVFFCQQSWPSLNDSRRKTVSSSKVRIRSVAVFALPLFGFAHCQENKPRQQHFIILLKAANSLLTLPQLFFRLSKTSLLKSCNKTTPT